MHGCAPAVAAFPGKTRADPFFLAHLGALHPRILAIEQGLAAGGMPGRGPVVKAGGEGQ